MSKKAAAREGLGFSVRVRCVSANVKNSGGENECVMFRFQVVSGHQEEPGLAWVEGAVVVHSKEYGKYQVGSEYDLKVEV